VVFKCLFTKPLGKDRLHYLISKQNVNAYLKGKLLYDFL